LPIVRKRGKWVRAFPFAVPKETAFAIGAKTALETPRRSFKVIKAPKGIPFRAVKQPPLPKGWLEMFRQPKSKALQGALVEKSIFAINEPGEKKGITQKGLEALARQYSFGFKTKKRRR